MVATLCSQDVSSLVMAATTTMRAAVRIRGEAIMLHPRDCTPIAEDHDKKRKKKKRKKDI